MEYHVRHIALPKPGDWRQLCILAARIHSQPLRRDKPMWELYVIEGLNNMEGYPPNCFALLMKVHHCAMDGATGTQFMNIVHDLTPEIREVGEAPPWIVERPSMPSMLGRAYVDAWRKPGQVVEMLREAGPAFMRLRRGRRKNNSTTSRTSPKPASRARFRDTGWLRRANLTSRCAGHQEHTARHHRQRCHANHRGRRHAQLP